MKFNKLLSGLVGICLFFGFTSCVEDKRIFGDDIEIPELTDDNTVQFTVEVASDWKQIEVIAGRRNEWLLNGETGVSKDRRPGNDRTYKL